MSSYSVIREGEKTGSGGTVDSIGAVLDQTLEGLKYGETITINEVEKSEDGDITISPELTRQILEDLTDRACKNETIKYGVPKTLSEFTDWLRGLYPELYLIHTGNRTAQQRQ